MQYKKGEGWSLIDENEPGTLYERLGVSSSADPETLRRAFRKLSKSLHPDTSAMPVDQAERQFLELCQAYELLADPIRRQSYDASLAEALSMERPSGLKSTPKPNSRQQSSPAIGERRPLSGGELFSLLLLVGSLLLCVLLGFGVARFQSRELQVIPSWISVEQTQENPLEHSVSDVVAAFRRDPSGTPFLDVNGGLATAYWGGAASRRSMSLDH